MRWTGLQKQWNGTHNRNGPARSRITKEKDRTMNKSQAFKELLKGNDVILTCTYYERKETKLFESKYFGSETRKVHFNHIVNCTKNDFKDIATYYRGSKSDCVFTYTIAN